MKYEILGSKPAVHFKQIDLVAISDVHLGLEASMTSRGNYVPEFQLQEMKDELKKIRDESGCERILVNGDLKNEYSTRYSEKKELREFMETLKHLFSEVIVVKGNHDTFIGSILKEFDLEALESYAEGGIVFTHGHKEVDKEYDMLVIGHEHPAVALKDKIGVTEKFPCLIELNTDDGTIIVLPAYSKISNGSGINRIDSEDFLSPILNEANLKNAEITVVSREGGKYYFGTLQDLRSK